VKVLAVGKLRMHAIEGGALVFGPWKMRGVLPMTSSAL
jgi:hypothetical protein